MLPWLATAGEMQNIREAILKSWADCPSLAFFTPDVLDSEDDGLSGAQTDESDSNEENEFEVRATTNMHLLQMICSAPMLPDWHLKHPYQQLFR